MEGKIVMEIYGGDVVELKDGQLVRVHDIRQKGGTLKEKHIVVACDEWYPFSIVKRIVKRFGEK